MGSRLKVSVGRKALLARINRKLKPDLRTVRTLRGNRSRREVGDYYEVDLNRNAIVAMHVDLEDYARELGVLTEWERLEEEA